MADAVESSELAKKKRQSASAAKARPRASVQNPIDADDLPADLPSPSRKLSPTFSDRVTAPSSGRKTIGGRLASPRGEVASLPLLLQARPSRSVISTDFALLLRPENYHPLVSVGDQTARREPDTRPDDATGLVDLLAKGHFKAAAIAAVQELTTPTTANKDDSYGRVVNDELGNPLSAERLFALLYTRLACLILIGSTPLAANEVKVLEDINDAVRYVDNDSSEHIVPWELRVLNVRLQSLGYGDPRRAIMSYYDLGRETRYQIARAQDREVIEIWKARLRDLAIRVAGTLIEMNDFVGAKEHLITLDDTGEVKMMFMKALLWVQIGDLEAAQRCVNEASAAAKDVVLALCDMANGLYDSAVERWQRIAETRPTDEMASVNAAVCLLYLERMCEARTQLEGMVDKGDTSHALLFNLATIYELCTERSSELKVSLAKRVTARDEKELGWENEADNFKL